MSPSPAPQALVTWWTYWEWDDITVYHRMGVCIVFRTARETHCISIFIFPFLIDCLYWSKYGCRNMPTKLFFDLHNLFDNLVKNWSNMEVMCTAIAIYLKASEAKRLTDSLGKMLFRNVPFSTLYFERLPPAVDEKMFLTFLIDLSQ